MKKTEITTPIFCLKDTKGGFINPFKMQNEEMAKRAFISSFFNEQDEIMCKFPADYELWKVAQFNDRTGEVTADLELIITGIEAMNKANAAKRKKGDE